MNFIYLSVAMMGTVPEQIGNAQCWNLIIDQIGPQNVTHSSCSWSFQEFAFGPDRFHLSDESKVCR